MLSELLAKGSNGTGALNEGGFWHFIAAVAQGRGITENLHAAGLEAVNEVPQSPVSTFNSRQHRAYHIRLLAQLILGLGASPDHVSVLPSNFNHGAVVADLLQMLEGPGGMGEAAPQMLYSNRQAATALIRYARQRLVGTVLWRIGHTGKTQDAVWRDLMGDDAEKTRLDRWLKALGGRRGEFGRSALVAGQAGDLSSPYAASNEELAEVVELANSGPGKPRAKSSRK
ncbi:hypothetical protein DDE20_01880 [Pararhodobacter oceanensis]|uniref:Uncharacterized protein n=2 Tax=Pararhodobacter oceanensis TaxID=2172121 RepID=A0A2T8HY17_9RHOB|nr:hypothetical protein DDE20_01880 [Pararhodobacter oceanensis]